jgi:hypothetical protein
MLVGDGEIEAAGATETAGLLRLIYAVGQHQDTGLGPLAVGYTGLHMRRTQLHSFSQ